ncbi:MAG: hypothetical protein P0S95_06710 [Rhabdochlamydiaceae bacterium]|nr:hypothetical protein [Candidatus Amphrikana amoebophyrae]
MKNLIVLLTLLVGISPLSAQIGKIPSTFNYERGEEVAQIYQKPMVLCFLASDECIWSDRFIKEVLDDPKFYEEMRKQFIFTIADFPKINTQEADILKINNELKEKFNIVSFPTFILLSHDGEEITRLSFPTSGHADFAHKIGSLFDEYTNLVKEVENNNPHRDVKPLYIRALSLNTPKLVEKLLQEGLKSEDNGYFLIEKYVSFSTDGKRDSQEARKIRRQILKLQGDELSAAKMRLALCDFQALHNVKPNVAVGMIYRLIDHGKLEEDEVAKLNHLLANHFIEEKDYMTAKRFADKMAGSSSNSTRKEGEKLVTTIEKMISY